VLTETLINKKDKAFYKEQEQTPFFSAIKKYVDDKILTFHCPGHQQGKGADKNFKEFFGDNVFKADISYGHGIDDLHQPQGVIKEAQRLAAIAYGADFTYFLINGSSSGNQATIMTACKPGDKIIVPRNAHKSVTSALILSGANPVYVLPEFDEEIKVDHTITLENTEKALKENPDAKAVFILSPTYYGATADLAGLIDLAHSHDKIAIVDEAWGPHLHFCGKLPVSAMSAGADMCVNSTHKIISGMSQSSMLHAKSGRIDMGRLGSVIRIFLSTSPNSLLLSSLDVARMQMATNGEKLLDICVELGDYAREKIRQIPGFTVYGRDIIGRPGVHDYDPTRLVFSAKDLGFSGYMIEELLRKYGIQIEMSDLFNVVVLITIGHTKEDVDKLINALGKISKKHKDKDAAQESELLHKRISTAVILPDFSPQVMTPREAFVSEHKIVKFSESAGLISNEVITPYPPGIPVLCPGERITRDIIEYLQIELKAGGHIDGPADPSLETIRVVK